MSIKGSAALIIFKHQGRSANCQTTTLEKQLRLLPHLSNPPWITYLPLATGELVLVHLEFHSPELNLKGGVQFSG